MLQDILKATTHTIKMRITRLLLHNFRTEFSFPTKDTTHFFPSHMARGLQSMHSKMKNVDCVIEVHDARIPLSGRNPHFQETFALRSHILMLNKMDLADTRQKKLISDKIKNEYGGQHVVFTTCKNDRKNTVKNQLMPAMLDLLEANSRYHREGIAEYNLLVIGLPNVGKSSLINLLRGMFIKTGKKATPVGPHAGVTRSVLERIRVCHEPKIYVYDTPGIMMPTLPDMDMAMKLALCGTLTDYIVGHETIVDYMLFWMNAHEYFKYVDYFKLEKPTDNILELLSHIAKEHKAVTKHRSTAGEYVFRPNFNYAAKLALQAFREGHLGYFNLDQDLLEENNINNW